MLRSAHAEKAARLARLAGRERRSHRPETLAEHLEPRCLLSTVFWDGGPSGLGTNWHDAANWAGDVLPGANDDAVIDVAPNPTISINAPAAVRRLTCAEAVSLTSTLSLSLSSTVDRGLTMTGGTLTGDGNLTLGGGSTWSGGTMIGPGATVVAEGASLTLSPAGQVNLTGRTLTNHGALNWTGGQWVVNNATISNEERGVFTVSSTGGMVSNNNSGVIQNRGAVVKTGEGETRFTDGFSFVRFNNEAGATLSVLEDTLRLDRGTNNGNFTVAGPARLWFPGDPFMYTHAQGSVIEGAGEVEFNGSQEFTGVATLRGPDMRLRGTFLGAGTALIEGRLTWASGSMTDAGRTEIAQGGVLDVVGQANLSGRTLTNHGELNWTTGQWRVQHTTVTNEATGVFTVSSTGGMPSNNNSGVIQNRGSVVKIGVGETWFADGSGFVRFNNETGATLSVLEGTLRLDYGTNNGSFTVAGPARLWFPGNPFMYTHAQGSVIEGAGEVEFNGSQEFTGVATLRGSDMTLNGTFVGAGTALVEGRLTWASGSMTGPGRTEIAQGGALDVAGQVNLSGRTLTNHDELNWTGGQWVVNNATIANEATGVFTVSSTGGMPSNNNSGVIQNRGSVVKIGVGQTWFTDGSSSVRFNNETGATLGVLEGTLRLDYGTNNGNFTVAGPARLWFPGNPFTYTHSQGSVIEGAGEVEFNGTQEFTGVATLRGTDMTLNGVFQGAGTALIEDEGRLTWVSGRMDGTGRTEIAEGGVLDVAGPGTLTLGSRTLANHGELNWTGGQWRVDSAVVSNEEDGLFIISSPGPMWSHFNVGSVQNRGELRKIGPATTSLTNGEYQTALNNLGTVRVEQGRLILPEVQQVAANTLTGGTWIVEDGRLDPTETTAVHTSHATVRLDGPSATFSQFEAVRNNHGTLVLANGRAFTFGQPAPATFFNFGTFCVEDGTAVVPSGITFSNTGEVRADNGTIRFEGPVPQLDPQFGGHVLLDGEWSAVNDGRIDMPWVSELRAIAGATVYVHGGPNASFSGLPFVNSVQGELRIGAGALVEFRPTAGTCEVTGSLVVDGHATVSSGRTLRNIGQVLVGSHLEVRGSLIHEFAGTFTSTGTLEIAAGGFAECDARTVNLPSGFFLIDGTVVFTMLEAEIGADTTLTPTGLIGGASVAFTTHLLWQGVMDVPQVTVLDDATVDLDGSAGRLELRRGSVKQFGRVRWNGAPIAGDPLSAFVLVSPTATFEALTSPQNPSLWTAPGTTSPRVINNFVGLVRVFGGGVAEILPLDNLGRLNIESASTLRTTDPGPGTVNIAQGAAVELLRPNGFNNTLEAGTWNIAGRLEVLDGNNTPLPIQTNAANMLWRNGIDPGESLRHLSWNTGTFVVDLPGLVWLWDHALANSGMLEIRGGEVVMSGPGGRLDNAGSIVLLNEARLVISGGGANDGSIDLDGGTSLVFNGDYEHNASGAFLGSGNVFFSAGTHEDLELAAFEGAVRFGDGSPGGVDTRIRFSNEFVIDDADLLQDAAIDGGTVVVEQSFVWDGGTLPSIRVEEGATLTISGDEHIHAGLCRIVNHGTINWSAGQITILDNAALPSDFAWLTNHRTVNLTAAATAWFDRTTSNAHPTIANLGEIKVGGGATTFAGVAPGTGSGTWLLNGGGLVFDAALAPPRNHEWTLAGVWRATNVMHAVTFRNAVNGARVDIRVAGEVDCRLYTFAFPGPPAGLTLTGSLTVRENHPIYNWFGRFDVAGGTLIITEGARLQLQGGGAWTNGDVRLTGAGGARLNLVGGTFTLLDTTVVQDHPPSEFDEAILIATEVELSASSIDSDYPVRVGSAGLRLVSASTLRASLLEISDQASVHVGSTCSVQAGFAVGSSARVFNFGEITILGESELQGQIETGPEGLWIIENPLDGPGTHVTFGQHFTAPNLQVRGGAIVSFLSGATLENLALDGTIDDATILTVSESFEWRGGTLVGDGAVMLAPGSTWLMTDPGARLLARDLVNEGSATYSDGSLSLDDASLRNAAGALFDASAAAGLSAAGGPAAFINEGDFAVTGAQPFVIETLFDNQGTVATTGAPLQLTGGLLQLSGDVLTGGDWHILPGTNIGLPPGASIRVIGAGASVRLDGAGAAWGALAPLAEVRGALALRNGATFTAAGALLNLGLTDLGAETMRVTGAYAQGAAGTLRAEIAGVGVHGRLIAGGPASIDGAFEALYTGGFSPPEFSRYRFLTGAAGVSGLFASFAAPAAPEGDTSVLVYDAGAIELLSTDLADFNFDGALDIFDFLEFQNLFALGDPRADLDGSTGPGVLDIFDFLAFLNLFSDG